MKQPKQRVLLFHNMVVPYRHALFRELAQRVNLKVLYATRTSADRKWPTPIPDDYTSEVLNGPTLYAFRRPLTVCPSLLSTASRFKPHAILSVLTRANAIDVWRLGRWAAKNDVPFVLWVGDIDNVGAHCDVPGVINGIFARLFGRILPLASGFVCYSSRSLDWLHARGINGPTVVGTQVLDPPPLDPRLGVERQPRRFQMVFAGKLETRKGVHVLVEALQALRPALQARLRLTTAGSGPLEKLVREQCPGSIELRMLGFVPRAQLFEVYRQADALIVPSLHDPWPNVINESMALGTPVIASRQCGSAELTDQIGWSVDARSVSSLVDGIAAAMEQARDSNVRRRAVQVESHYRPARAAADIAELLRAV